MPISKDTEKQIRPIADESLTTFSNVAEAAKARLADASSVSNAGAFASINTFTDTEILRNRQRITDANIEGYRVLTRQPANARVVITDEDGQKTTYYFSRAAPVLLGGEGIVFASYRSPVGRLAALSIGSEHTLTRDGRPVSVQVQERARFQPIQTHNEWDAHNSILEGDTYGPLTIVSLRNLVGRLDDDVDVNALKSLLAEEYVAINVREGIRRGIIRKMDLRDQPILDEYQDDIFRRPLNSRLLLLGAPGTGKTTTLIRRLGQKLDATYLDEDERVALQSATHYGDEAGYARSWILFAPTDLLKLYVKEAFNREGIPAPDDRISTWADCREGLARNEFGFLRSAVGTSSLVMTDNAATLAPGTEVDQISWFMDFYHWQQANFWEDLHTSAQKLSQTPAQNLAKLGSTMLSVLNAAGPTPPVGTFVSLMASAGDIKTLVDTMKESTDTRIRGVLNLQVNRDKHFLDEMVTFNKGLTEMPDDPDDQDAEDEEETSEPTSCITFLSVDAFVA